MATSNTRYRPDWSSGGITAPNLDEVLLGFSERMAKQQDAELDRALKQQQLTEEQRRWDIANSRAQRKEDRELAEQTATQEALKAVIDPKAYQSQKMSAEQAGINASLNNLSPQERAVAEQQLRENYDKNLSRDQWLTNALMSPNADQSKVLSTQKSVYDLAVSTPGTKEYLAKQQADREQKQWELDASTKKAMALENYRTSLAERKDAKSAEGLLAALRTPTEKISTKDVIINADLIKGVEDTNKKIEDKAKIYGEELNKALKGNKTLDHFDNLIQKAEADIETEKLRSNIFGKDSSPAVDELIRKRRSLESSKNALIESINDNTLAKTGLGSNWQQYLSEVPSPEIVKQIEKTPLTKQEWLESALSNIGQDASTSTIKALMDRADKQYPQLSVEDKAKFIEKQDIANDLKKTIETLTHKEPTSKTLDGLKKELEIAMDKSKNSDKSPDKGLGPQTLSTMISIGIDNEDIDAIVEAAKNKKVDDKVLSKIVEDNNSYFRNSGYVKDDIIRILNNIPNTTNNTTTK